MDASVSIASPNHAATRINHPFICHPGGLRYNFAEKGRAMNLKKLGLRMAWVARNCPTGIGVTDAVCRQLADSQNLVRRGEIAVPGAESPITIYEPELEASHGNDPY